MGRAEFRVGERAHITVDGDACRGCTTKACVVACPANLFVPTADGGILFNYEQCFECGTCYLVCNTGAPSRGPTPKAATASSSGARDAPRRRAKWVDLRPEVDPLTCTSARDARTAGCSAADRPRSSGRCGPASGGTSPCSR